MISVILPVYNGGAYLKDSIESVLDQEFQNFEFIIVDDCSTDGSIDVIRHYASDTRIRIIENKSNQGLFKTLNDGISHANGEFIKVWAQDDIMMPRCLEVFNAAHKTCSTHAFIWSQSTRIQSTDTYQRLSAINEQFEFSSTAIEFETWGMEKVVRHFLYCGCLHGNISLFGFSKKTWQTLDGFDEAFIYSGDIDFTARTLNIGPPVCIPIQTVWLRVHAGQLSRNVNHLFDELKETKAVQKKLSKEFVKPEGLKEFEKVCNERIRIPYFVSNALRVARKFPSKGWQMIKATSDEYSVLMVIIFWFKSRLRRSFGKSTGIKLEPQ